MNELDEELNELKGRGEQRGISRCWMSERR